MSLRHALGLHSMYHYHCALDGHTSDGVYYRFCIDECSECDRKQVTRKYPDHEWVPNPGLTGVGVV